MLSSLPPDVEVPLPLGEEVEPVVWGGAALGLEVLAAGSPVIDPLPLGLPCAETPDWVTVKTTNTAASNFMLPPYRQPSGEGVNSSAMTTAIGSPLMSCHALRLAKQSSSMVSAIKAGT